MATPRQRLAIKKVLSGTKIKHAMLEANYSPKTAATTGKLTRSKGWLELTEKTLSDRALLKVHREGLGATQVRFTPEGEQIRVEDYSTRHKYLETGYKIKHKLDDPEGGNKTMIVIIAGESATRYGVRPA